MEYDEEDYLLLSGIQHFAFCRRQWALIHIEQQWAENVRTFEGQVLHEHAHNAEFREKRGDLLVIRAMKVSSRTMGVSGECDVVEFRRSKEGITLHGQEGLYTVVPVEYKRGAPKGHDADKLQLAAQALCLEEMLAARIPVGYLYYGQTRRREEVVFTEELRIQVQRMFAEMHAYFDRKYTPKVKTGSFCKQCSLYQVCIPQLCDTMSAKQYVERALREEVT